MAVTDLLATIESNFDTLKASADDALAALKLQAQWSAPNLTYGLGDTSVATTNEFIPIAIVNSVDDMIITVNNLAAKIDSINYNPPTELTSFEMLNHKVWSDVFADKIETSLSDYLTSMGIPDKSYQDAIFNEDYNRKLQTLNDLYDLADAKVGARGFTYNNDQSTALKLDAQQKYQFDLTQIGRDITKLVTEWARQNYQFAIDKGISFEQFHADFTYKYCTGYVDIYKNLVMASIERFKAELGKYVEPIRALIEAAKLPLEVSKMNTDINIANANTNLEAIKLQVQEAVQVYDANVRSSLGIFQTQVQALSEVAKETASFIQAASRSVIGIQK